MEMKLDINDVEIFRKNKQLEAVINTLESDRKRIAQDLHDDIGSKLNVISLNCHLLKTPNLSSKDIDEITKNIIEYTSKALTSSKNITHRLLPPVLERFGLNAGIQELCTELNDTKSVEGRYENKVKFEFKENDKHIHVFRILQELLANSLKHGKATEVSISIDEIEGKKTCRYSDNGIGFDRREMENSKGLGMKNIESRITVLDGTLIVESSLNAGISVIFNF